MRAMRAEIASRCAGVGHVGPGQKPACAGCVPVSRSMGGQGSVCVQKLHDTQRRGGGGGGAGAGTALLARARVVVGTCRAPGDAYMQQVAWPGKEGAMGWEGGEAAHGWKMRRECVGGGGRRRCGGGWGCCRTLPRGRVVATGAGEQGGQLDRGGDLILPTRRVREGADGQRQRLWRGGGKVAWQRGAMGSADQSKWRRSSPKVFLNVCRCETAWGTKGGMRRTCVSAERCGYKSARGRGSSLATRLAAATTSAASVLDRPPAQSVTGYTVAPEAACGHALAATCHPALVYTACGEHSSVGKKQRAQVAARRRSTRRVRQKVHEDGTRCARTEAGVREVRAGAAEHGGAGGRLRAKVA